MSINALYFIILCLWGLCFILAIIKESNIYSGLFVLSTGMMIGFVITALTITGKPTAIDVYKGKTTLEITYRDTVPIDTVVVFKK